MSSWIIAKSAPRKVAQAKEITSYHDTSSGSGAGDIYLKFIAAAIHKKSLNETCTVWDPTSILRVSLKMSPLLNILKEKPTVEPDTLDMYMSTVAGMKYTEVQKYISNVYEYNDRFKMLIDRVVQTIEIRGRFDLCIHISSDSISLESYVDMVKIYLKKFNKQSVSIYIMADSYTTVETFKSLCDSTWKVLSLSKFETTNDTDKFIQTMAEVKIMSAANSMILDFSKPINRLIYLLHNPKDELEYFKEINKVSWYLLDE